MRVLLCREVYLYVTWKSYLVTAEVVENAPVAFYMDIIWYEHVISRDYLVFLCKVLICVGSSKCEIKFTITVEYDLKDIRKIEPTIDCKYLS